MTTGGSYVHKPMVKLFGYPENVFAQNKDGFRQNNSLGF